MSTFDDKSSSLAIIHAMAREIQDVLEKYNETMSVATVIGVLEAIKMEIILSYMPGFDEEEDDDDFLN
jgi:hypothetical protein